MRKPVLSTPALALLTLQLDQHVCERMNSAEPAVVYFSPLLESIRLRNLEGTAAIQVAVIVLHPWPSLVALVLYLHVPHTSSSRGRAVLLYHVDRRTFGYLIHSRGSNQIISEGQTRYPFCRT